LEEWSHEKDQVMTLKERVDEAKRIALQEIKVSAVYRLHVARFQPLYYISQYLFTINIIP